MKLNVQYPINSTFLDFPDPENHALIVFVMGCTHSCEGCHNVNFKNSDYAVDTRKFDNIDEFNEELKIQTRKNRTGDVVFSGGDPLSVFNVEFIKSFLDLYGLNYRVCIYTGHDFEYVQKKELKNYAFIKTGRYDSRLKQRAEKTDMHMKFSSSNQVLYDARGIAVSQNGIYLFN
jgi:organic radical activating enzyme